MIFYILWVNVIVILNYLAASYAKYRAETFCVSPYKALPDILQETLPPLPKYIPDYMLVLLGGLVYFLNIAVSLHEFDRLLYCLSLRPLFVCATIFPTCMEKTKDSKQIIHKILHSTHDLMFSGHTCCFMFFGRLIGGNVGTIVGYIFPITLVQAKQHYTIDTVVSMLVYNAVVKIT